MAEEMPYSLDAGWQGEMALQSPLDSGRRERCRRRCSAQHAVVRLRHRLIADSVAERRQRKLARNLQVERIGADRAAELD